MLSRLAYRNTRKSFGDFAVYFLTLTFGVMAFYAFGSIDAQTALLDAETGLENHAQNLSTVMDVLSVIVAVVLAFLVVYANSFLIKRRKREFGTYLILGMPRRQVSAILLMETLLVGVAALIAGLALGVAASQGLSVMTANLFEIDMSAYRFVFSPTSMLKTMGFFVLLFAAVSILNLLGFSRQTVSRLLNASKRSEPRVRNPLVSVALALIGLVLILTACATLLTVGLIDSVASNAIWLQIAAGCLGTFLLFAGGSGLVLKLLQSNRSSYLRGLNPFVIRQLDAKMSSTFATMAMVCITLFFAMVILGGGLSFGSVLNNQADIPYDVSFIRFADDGTDVDMFAGMADMDIDLSKLGTFHQFEVFESEVTAKTLLGENWNTLGEADIPLNAISETDANALLRLQGLAEVNVGDEGFALFGPYGSAQAGLSESYAQMELEITGHTLRSVPDGMVDTYSGVDGSIAGLPTLVLPDDLLSDAQPWHIVISGVYSGDAAATDRLLLAADEMRAFDETDPYNYMATKLEVHGEVLFVRAIVTFIGLYVGLILLVTSAAILALQQLSEATDNKDRYVTLSKIGVDRKMMAGSVRRQVATYFGTPLLVALAYTLVGGKVTVDVIDLFGQVDIARDYSLSVIAIAVVYGGYFVATSIAARRIALEG